MLNTICPYCGLEISEDTDSCELDHIKVNDTWYTRKVVSYGGESFGKRCKGCGILIAPKNYHHFGCPNEECPVCWRAASLCNCRKQALKKNDKIIKIT